MGSKRGRLGSQTQTLPKLGEHAAVSRPDIPDLPVMRNATKPGQFRKTNYDPFSYGVKTGDGQEGGEALIDSSLHRHLDNGLGFKKMKSVGASSRMKYEESKPSESNPETEQNR